MTHYQVIVHYHFKEGKAEEGIKFLETELLKKAQEYGCHDIELCQNERDPTELRGLTTWNSVDEARQFQSHWEAKEKELLRYCTNVPKREVFKIRSSYQEKLRKSA